MNVTLASQRCLVHLENPIHLKRTQKLGGGEEKKKHHPLDTQYNMYKAVSWPGRSAFV